MLCWPCFMLLSVKACSTFDICGDNADICSTVSQAEAGYAVIDVNEAILRSRIFLAAQYSIRLYFGPIARTRTYFCAVQVTAYSIV